METTSPFETHHERYDGWYDRHHRGRSEHDNRPFRHGIQPPMQPTNRSGETRRPSEDRDVTISRAAGSLTFPANFMPVAAMNHCPCGYWGNSGDIGGHMCRCSVRQIENYRQRISGTLLDRNVRVFM